MRQIIGVRRIGQEIEISCPRRKPRYVPYNRRVYLGLIKEGILYCRAMYTEITPQMEFMEKEFKRVVRTI